MSDHTTVSWHVDMLICIFKSAPCRTEVVMDVTGMVQPSKRLTDWELILLSLKLIHKSFASTPPDVYLFMILVVDILRDEQRHSAGEKQTEHAYDSTYSKR